MTCKARLEHVQQTLPKLINFKDTSVIFVDYGCPENSGLWVKKNYPSVNVINVTDDQKFCLARARNIGASHAHSPWLFFIDADILINSEMESWISSNLINNQIYRASLINGERVKDTWGSFICPREIFEKIGGYDEVFKGWGGEDVDIYKRINKILIPTFYFPAIYLVPIQHSDYLRTLDHEIKSKILHQVICELYITSKSYFSADLKDNKQLPFELRTELMNKITDKVLEWERLNRPSSFYFNLKISHLKWLPASYKMNVTATLKLMIDH